MKRVIAIVLAASLVSGYGLPAAVKLNHLRSTELVWQRWNKRLRNMLYLSQHLKDCALFRSLQNKKICLDEELTAAEGTGGQ